MTLPIFFTNLSQSDPLICGAVAYDGPLLPDEVMSSSEVIFSLKKEY